MGLQLSKRTADVVDSSKSKVHRNSISEANSEQHQQQHEELAETVEAGGTNTTRTSTTAAGAAAEEALAEVRQIIIKIQLAKMENGNQEEEQRVREGEREREREQLPLSEGAATSAADDIVNANEQMGAGASRTAGSSSTEAPKKTNERQIVNNNNLAGSIASESALTSAPTSVRMLQLHDGDVVVNDVVSEDGELEVALSSLLRRSSGEGVEYCEVLEPQPVNEMLSSGQQRTQGELQSEFIC